MFFSCSAWLIRGRHSASEWGWWWWWWWWAGRGEGWGDGTGGRAALITVQPESRSRFFKGVRLIHAQRCSDLYSPRGFTIIWIMEGEDCTSLTGCFFWEGGAWHYRMRPTQHLALCDDTLRCCCEQMRTFSHLVLLTITSPLCRHSWTNLKVHCIVLEKKFKCR